MSSPLAKSAAIATAKTACGAVIGMAGGHFGVLLLGALGVAGATAASEPAKKILEFASEKASEIAAEIGLEALPEREWNDPLQLVFTQSFRKALNEIHAHAAASPSISGYGVVTQEFKDWFGSWDLALEASLLEDFDQILLGPDTSEEAECRLRHCLALLNAQGMLLETKTKRDATRRLITFQQNQFEEPPQALIDLLKDRLPVILPPIFDDLLTRENNDQANKLYVNKFIERFRDQFGPSILSIKQTVVSIKQDTVLIPGMDAKMDILLEALQHKDALEAAENSSALADSHSRLVVPIPVYGEFDQLDRFSGRQDDLDWLTKVGGSWETKIAAIIGIAGNGKTALGRNWVKQQIEKAGRKFSGVFEWRFYLQRSQEECAAELEKFLTRQVGASERRSNERLEDWLAEQIERRPILLLLDGIEVLQTRSGQTAGRLQNGPIRDLLELMCVNEVATGLAVVTSRTSLSDFKRHEGFAYHERELRGLSEEDGLALLKNVRDVGEAEKRKYVRDLKGHPLALRTFALIAKQQPMRFGNAAAFLAMKLDLVADLDLKQRLEKILNAYEGGLEPLDREILRTVSVFPAGCTGQMIASLVVVAASRERRIDPSQVARRLQSLVNDGVLFGGGVAWREAQNSYSCHPIYREHFRVNSNDVARVAATVLLSGHPSGFQPRNPSEAMPYLHAIEILSEAGDLKTANYVLGNNLDWADTLTAMGEPRLALDCLNCFLGDDRRAVCEATFSSRWLYVMTEKYIGLLMDMGEWQEAERQVRLAEEAGGEWEPAGVLAHLRFRIEKEIGSPAAARESLLAYVKQGSPKMGRPAVFDLAEIERRLGRFDESCLLTTDWIRETARR
ncbi:NACHT domain-containing protein [Terriglobus roseus]|uniref:NACHT domain-containing protein n=1 Tax=Terriglobus roseus TaxID=392734 RepID=A0A1G7GPJ8_9BACT|nr:NACHT domain-containing protein [Terriglobus roseus]SDE90011.1 NACHT domain-containing protein [Terriglobus roseus]